MKPVQLMRYRSIALPPSGDDPFFNDVVLLLNMEGADASTAFTDLSPLAHTMTAGGNVQVDTSLGYNAALFDGSGDNITTPYVKADFDWWTSDFTLELWLRIPSGQTSTWYYTDGGYTPSVAIGCANPASTTNYWSFGITASRNARFYYYNGSGQSVTSSNTFAEDTLVHIAMVKTASGIALPVNGVFGGSPVAVSGTPQSSAVSPVKLTIGQINNRSLNGWLKAVRATRGARWTGDFTPPPSPFATS